MSFLNDHIKRRRSYTNVSNLRCQKMIKIAANKSHTYISLSDSLSATKKDDQEMNLSMNSTIIKSTESRIFKIASQFLNNR
ncbi:transcription factor adf-1 [Vespula squamosa]|uniref:Transcription factor adf-1 n=1 Tax=Vespula squamosa TaxID=30214 RepID=A0ABD2B9S6_VESSQ